MNDKLIKSSYLYMISKELNNFSANQLEEIMNVVHKMKSFNKESNGSKF